MKKFSNSKEPEDTNKAVNEVGEDKLSEEWEHMHDVVRNLRARQRCSTKAIDLNC